jgi:hypothetical protein
VASRDELTLESESRRLTDADPFEAFTITVTSGERFAVGQRGDLIIGQNVATLIDAAGTVVIRKNQNVTVDMRGAAR